MNTSKAGLREEAAYQIARHILRTKGASAISDMAEKPWKLRLELLSELYYARKYGVWVDDEMAGDLLVDTAAEHGVSFSPCEGWPQ
jgi:hypothetical protein